MDPVWQPPKKFQDRDWLHVLLFVLTIGSTTLRWGWAYSATIIAILGCHELGHYIACRHYDVDASLPFFLPLPPQLTLSGTLGAFIRIREPIRYKRWLFDIGIAGPIAGFVIAVPALFIGIALSHFEPFRAAQGVLLGDPLLVKFFSWLIWGTAPDSELMSETIARRSSSRRRSSLTPDRLNRSLRIFLCHSKPAYPPSTSASKSLLNSLELGLASCRE